MWRKPAGEGVVVRAPWMNLYVETHNQEENVVVSQWIAHAQYSYYNNIFTSMLTYDNIADFNVTVDNIYNQLHNSKGKLTKIKLNDFFNFKPILSSALEFGALGHNRADFIKAILDASLLLLGSRDRDKSVDAQKEYLQLLLDCHQNTLYLDYSSKYQKKIDETYKKLKKKRDVSSYENSAYVSEDENLEEVDWSKAKCTTHPLKNVSNQRVNARVVPNKTYGFLL